MDVRVLILANDPLAQAGLRVLLADLPGLVVTGQAAASGDLKSAVEAYQPDVILWDLGWGIRDDVLEPDDFAEDLSSIPVVALLPEDAHVGAIWTTRVRGLLWRDANPDRIGAALVAAAQGLVVVEPALAADLASRMGEADGARAAGSLLEPLTPRELEVLDLLAEGLPNKSIAQRLGISEHTVKFHVNAIFGKLGVESRTEAVIRATRLGLILL